MVADLQRMGDLSVHVAKIARRRMPDAAVPDDVHPTICAMAAVADSMIEVAPRSSPTATSRPPIALEPRTTRWTGCARSCFRALLGDDWKHGVEPAVDLALLGRYYERIGDHAVSMARRVVYLVTGEDPRSVEV